MRIRTLLLLLLATGVSAAEYKGRNLDGESFAATAFSYDTSKYYYVDVEFDGTEAVITFDNGNTLTVELEDEEIEDPSSISVYDYQAANYWDLDMEDLDQDSVGPPRTSRSAVPASREPAIPPKTDNAATETDRTYDVESGKESELVGVATLCVTGDSKAAQQRMRENLRVLLDGLISVESADCIATATNIFIYDESDKLGIVVRKNREKRTMRALFTTTGSELEIAASLVKVLRHYRPTHK